VAVEEQIERLRGLLLEARTEAGFHEERPLCSKCGSTMVPRTQSSRQLILRGDHSLDLERSYVVCPSCGAGLFPPR
jgi:ribosomal protein S27AE